jgi:hypothetical protein
MKTAAATEDPSVDSPAQAQHPKAAPYPPNLHMGVGCPESGLAPLRERVEQKFFVLPHRESLAFALLRRTCRSEALYPCGQVNSLYFDTPDLDQHERSVSGEHAKDKVRVRWYGEEHDPHRSRTAREEPAEEEPIEAWLELKSRQGFASTKRRLAIDVPAMALVFSALPRGIVPAALLTQTMAGFGFIPRDRLCPVVAISYWRYRFVEPETGFRVSIDSHIRSSIVMPGIGRGERGLELPGAVVEVKGSRFDLPRSLRPIVEIGASWTRYSKYSSSLDGHDAVGGSVSRLWPSGTLDVRAGVVTRVRATGGAVAADRGLAGIEEREASRLAPRLVEDYETE